MERSPSESFESDDGEIVSGADLLGAEQTGTVRYQRINETDVDYSDRFAHEAARAAAQLVQDSTFEAAAHDQQRARAREFIDPMIDKQFDDMIKRAEEIISPRERASEIARIKALRVAYESKRGRRV